MDKSTAKELHNNLKNFVIDMRNNNNIDEVISHVSGNSSEIKQLLQLLNSIEDAKQKQQEQQKNP